MLHCKRLLKAVLPAEARQWLRTIYCRATEVPPYGCVRWGSLRRLFPIHRGFDVSRGQYIDRYYIEAFLRQHAADIRGEVLEFGDPGYTREFGAGSVTRSDVVDVRPNHPGATITADVTNVAELLHNRFDCIIMTQTLHVIYDTRAAVRNLYRMLRPGGVLLATVPGISQVAPKEMAYCGDYWRFTRLSVRRLLEEEFSSTDVKVYGFGNVLSGIAFLHGLAAQELHTEELEFIDPDYELVICARALKTAASSKDGKQ